MVGDGPVMSLRSKLQPKATTAWQALPVEATYWQQECEHHATCSSMSHRSMHPPMPVLRANHTWHSFTSPCGSSRQLVSWARARQPKSSSTDTAAAITSAWSPHMCRRRRRPTDARQPGRWRADVQWSRVSSVGVTPVGAVLALSWPTHDSARSYKQDFLSRGNPPILDPGPRTKKGSR